MSEYYKWRSRSGCYFCFFQRRDEWIGLAENHKDLFEKAKQYEKVDERTGQLFTWVNGSTLDDVLEQGRHLVRETSKAVRENKTWQEKMAADGEEDDACAICTL